MDDVDAINVVSDDEECDAVLLIQKHCRKLYWVLRKKEYLHFLATEDERLEIARWRYLAMIRVAIRLPPRWRRWHRRSATSSLLIQKHFRKFYWVLRKKEYMHYMEIVRCRYLAMNRIAIRLQPRWLQRKQCLSLTEN
jgi:hypothetical protein